MVISSNKSAVAYIIYHSTLNWIQCKCLHIGLRLQQFVCYSKSLIDKIYVVQKYINLIVVQTLLLYVYDKWNIWFYDEESVIGIFKASRMNWIVRVSGMTYIPWVLDNFPYTINSMSWIFWDAIAISGNGKAKILLKNL